jgi:hypothetical protein
MEVIVASSGDADLGASCIADGVENSTWREASGMIGADEGLG